MSLLGTLFDPIGAAVTGGNNNTFNSIFNPGDNALGDQGLGLEPSFMTNFNDSYQTPIGNFLDNVDTANIDELRNIGDHFKSSPTQLVTGVDPLSTKFWNAVTKQKNDPWVDQWGGETNQDMQKSANRGINMEDNGYASTLAHMIAAYYGGQALGNLGGSAWGSSTAGAGSEGSAGSSALDVQAELAGSPAAGSGSSQAGWDAAKIPGWTAGSGLGGAEGGHAAANVTTGAANGGAGALDSNQNVFKGTFQGGLRAGLGSNLDYAGGLGVDDPNYKNVINGGITGGVRAGMNDTSQTGYGALVGALSGLANTAGTAAGKYFSSPSSGDNGTATGTTNWGNLATTLGNLYMARRNDAGIQGQINGLNSLYAPNSPYAQQMQQQLDRQDAASGRRSQYGTRAVELQAKLADAASRNAPTLANLYAQQRMNRFNQYAGLLAGAKNSGALGSLFGSGQPQQPVMDNSYSPVSAGPSDYMQYDPNQVNNNVMATLPPMLGYGSQNPTDPYGG